MSLILKHFVSSGWMTFVFPGCRVNNIRKKKELRIKKKNMFCYHILYYKSLLEYIQNKRHIAIKLYMERKNLHIHYFTP